MHFPSSFRTMPQARGDLTSSTLAPPRSNPCCFSRSHLICKECESDPSGKSLKNHPGFSAWCPHHRICDADRARAEVLRSLGFANNDGKSTHASSFLVSDTAVSVDDYRLRCIHVQIDFVEEVTYTSNVSVRNPATECEEILILRICRTSFLDFDR